jgi:hypothetical protein
MRFQTLFATCCLLLHQQPLTAAEPRFGFQAALAQPMVDLPDTAAVGLQLGGHGQWDFGSGHGLQARADLTLYGPKDDYTQTSFGLAADYTFHPEQRPSRFYFLAGMSLLDYQLSLPGSSSSSSGLGFDLGVGYDVDRHLGYQMRFTTQSVDGLSLGSLNVGILYTF